MTQAIQQQQQECKTKYSTTIQHDWTKKGRMAARMMIMKKMKMMTAGHRQQQEQHKQTIQQQEQ